MATNVLAKMAVQISANTAEFNKALAKTNKDISSFTSGITKAAGAIGIAFGAQQIGGFVLEVAKLAGEAEAVNNAFSRLERSKQLLLELKQATHGTVSELELMKRAVMASNFDISLKALPRLLEFATLRAQQTGQSVDYLVDSIVTGIGRKSKLILDNLGISASQLKDEFHGASLEAQSVADVTEAVGRIAERNLQNMAKFSQNTASATQQLAASWDNLKVSIGGALNQGGLTSFFTNVASAAKVLSGDLTLSKERLNDALALLDRARTKAKELGEQGDVIKFTKAIAELTSQYGLIGDKALEFIDKGLIPQVETINSLNEKLKELKAINGEIAISDKQAITLSNIKIAQLEEQIRLLNELGKIKPAGKPSSVTPTNFSLSGSAEGTLVNPQAISDSINNARLSLPSLTEELKNVGQAGIEMSGLIVGGITDIASAFGEAAVTGAKDFGRAFLRSLGNFAKQFGSLLVAMGIGERSLKFGGPGAKIAAGIALIAIGGAISALMSKTPSMSGGGGGGSEGGFYRPSVGSSQFSNITVTGTLVGEGSTLLAVISSAESSNSRRRA